MHGTHTHPDRVPAGYRLAAGDPPALPMGDPVASVAGMSPSDRAAEPPRLDVEDWLALPDAPGLQEILDGELRLMAPPLVAHQRVSARLALRLGVYLASGDRGELFTAPTGVKLLDRHNGVEPDLFVILPDGAARVGERCVDGPPDLVIEIVSPKHEDHDRITKRDLYERAGVPEYWIVDPAAAVLDVLRRDTEGGGELRVVDRLGRGGIVTTPALPGLEIELREIFDRGD